MAKSKTQKAKGRKGKKRRRTSSLDNEEVRRMKKILETERLLYELWKEARKAKPLMSEEEALEGIHEWLKRRAERLLGRR
ncbi:MAG: hypothetical protein ACK4I8_02100 [Armatimonadota bacterium]